MHTTLLPLALSLLSLSSFVSHVTSSEVAHVTLPLEPRHEPVGHAALAPRSSTDLTARPHLKQVTRAQILERQAKAKLLKARSPGGGPAPPPAPQSSPIPPTCGEFTFPFLSKNFG